MMIKLYTVGERQRRTTMPGCKPRPLARRTVTVGFRITTRDVADRTQIFAKRPGRYLFRGLWAEPKAHRANATQHKNYSKVEGQVGLPIGKVVGKRLTPFLLRRMKN